MKNNIKFNVICVVTLCLVGVACTNSKLVLRRLYNSFDNRFEDRLLEHANFDKSQTREIKNLIDHYHVWHRKTQLDDYALFLEDIVGHLRNKNEFDQADIDRWSNAIQTYRSNILSCSPLYASAKIAVSLTDQQIVEIKRHRDVSEEKRRARREARREKNQDFSLAESIDDRVKQINRYLGFAGLDLNREQIADLSKTMTSTVRPATRFRTIRDKLDEELYELLESRNDANWEELLVDYIDKRRQTFADWRNESRLHNQSVWEAYALRTFRSLSEAQKIDAANYLGKLASTLKALATDRPSYQSQSAGDYVCLGQRVS